MRSEHFARYVLAAAMVCLTFPQWCDSPARGTDQVDGNEDVDAFQPVWHLGDSWTVETRTRRVQAGEQPGETTEGRPVAWQFTVRAIEKVHERDCFRVEVKCLSDSGRFPPQTTLWVDTQALVLRQFQTQIRVADSVRTLTESYDFPGQQPTPVMGPLTVLPIDLPLLLGGRMKGSQTFTYEAIPGPSGTKAVGNIAFAYEVAQDLDSQPAAQARQLLHADFAKALEDHPLLEVKLKTVDRRVRQLWQAGLPWPAYSENGTTVARLVKWTPAPNTDSENR